MSMPVPAYFQYANAWRAAFFAMLESEQPTEIPCRGVETHNGPYITYEPTNEQTKAKKKLAGSCSS